MQILSGATLPPITWICSAASFSNSCPPIQFLFKFDANPLRCLLPPPIQIPCSILIERRMAILAGASLHPNTYSLFNSYPSLMQILSEAFLPPLVVSYWIPFLIWCNILPLLPCIPLWSFLIEFLFEYDAISCPGCLTYLLPWWFRIEFLFKYDAISSHCCLASSCGRFLLNSYSNMMQYPLMAALPPMVVFNWIPIQILCNILSWLPCLLPWWFRI